MTASSPESGKPLRERKAGAGRRQSRESQVLKVPRGAHIPRIRNHETSSLVERAKGFAPRGQRGLRRRVMRARNETGYRLQWVQTSSWCCIRVRRQ